MVESITETQMNNGKSISIINPDLILQSVAPMGRGWRILCQGYSYKEPVHTARIKEKLLTTKMLIMSLVKMERLKGIHI